MSVHGCGGLGTLLEIDELITLAVPSTEEQASEEACPRFPTVEKQGVCRTLGRMFDPEVEAVCAKEGTTGAIGGTAGLIEGKAGLTEGIIPLTGDTGRVKEDEAAGSAGARGGAGGGGEGSKTECGNTGAAGGNELGGVMDGNVGMNGNVDIVLAVADDDGGTGTDKYEGAIAEAYEDAASDDIGEVAREGLADSTIEAS